jgi:hypothetical protein
MINLSNRQYPLLQSFISSGDHSYMTLDQAHAFDQRPFRSMLMRNWVAYRPGRSFYTTKEGKQAWSDFHQTEIVRRNPELPLCAYFREKYDVTELPARKRVKREKRQNTANATALSA